MNRRRTLPALLSAALAATLLLLPSPATAATPGVVAATAVAPQALAPRSLALTTAALAPATEGQRNALRDRLNTALAGSTASLLGAAVDVEGYGSVLRAAADAPLPPASTQKSYVGLSALLALGAQTRYRTEVVADRRPVLGRLRGNLWLVAGGDPYLSSASLRLLARSVRAAGITSVSGELRLDDLRYDQRRTAAGWKPSFMPGQSAPLSAMAVDGNRWRSDATFLADPAIPAAVLFRDYLRAEGVSIGSGVRRDPRPGGGRTVAVHSGTPLLSAVQRTLKDSDNFAAELILKEVGRVVRGDGSSAGGVEALRTVLAARGVPVGAGSDGSGLSGDDRQTSVGQVQLLQAARTTDVGPAFLAALPLGCRDGTLKKRFCGTAAEGRVSAKTGTLSGVRVLAGVTTTRSGRQVQFAFQLSGVADGTRALAAIDRAVVVLADSAD